MEIIGKVIQVLPLQQGVSARTNNPWMIKTFVLETQENYPRKVAIEIFGEQAINNNPCEVDQIVTVSFDLESREFNGRWYTSVRAWKIQQGTMQNQQPVQQPSAPAAATLVPPQAAAPQAPVASAAPQVIDAPAEFEDNSGLPF